MSDDTPHLFIFGLGYVGARLARRARAQGWNVSGTHRMPVPEPDGIEVLAFDGRMTPALDAALATATHVASTVPPHDGADPVLAACGDRLYASDARWFGYLSTTGVYGDAGGDWVDEDTPVAPSSERARARVAAETAWRALESPARVVNVFRLAGIYGPGRSAFDRLRAGTARRIDKPGQVFSRCHVED
ncbi:MAG: SDR family NAD(P)-dependent oxidoreductase, partial [Chromatiales bacterium]